MVWYFVQSKLIRNILLSRFKCCFDWIVYIINAIFIWNVCVNLTSSWGATLITWFEPQGWLTLPQHLQCHTPSESAHQFSPWGAWNWQVSLGNVDRTATANFIETIHGCLPAWCITLWHLGSGSYDLPFLPFQISEEYISRVVSVTMYEMTLIPTQAKP